MYDMICPEREEVSKTYYGGGLRCLDWETVWLDGGARAFFVAFAVFALDLWCFASAQL